MKQSVLLLTTAAAWSLTVHAAQFKITSPDGRGTIAVTDAGGLSYSAFLGGREGVRKPSYGIIAAGVDLGPGVTLKKASSRAICQSYPMFGGHTRALNCCRETTLSVRAAEGTISDNFRLELLMTVTAP